MLHFYTNILDKGTDRGNDVLPPMYEYLRPLIIGEPDIRYKNGLPDYMDISHLTKA